MSDLVIGGGSVLFVLFVLWAVWYGTPWSPSDRAELSDDELRAIMKRVDDQEKWR